MLFYMLRRLGQAIVVMVVVSFSSFVLFDYVGDPVNNMVGQEASLADRAALRARLGLDDPLLVRFARFLVDAARGEFGISYRLRRPVAELIAERLPATLELVAVSAVLALAIGIPLGVYTGIRRDGRIARVLMAISLVGVSLPTFVIGIGLIYLFSVTLGWLPSFGRGEVVRIGFWTTGLLTVSGLKAIVLPALTLALYQLALVMRLVRAEMLEVLRTDYIKFARARGLPERSILFVHALRNALVPVITITGIQLGSLIAFATVTETVFQWPGMGSLFIQAVQFADIPIMAAYLVLVALLFVTINLLVDLLYFVVDPRVRTLAFAAHH
ncbi:MAG: ABC transporter permease [Geminicoccaceae bacterium]|nr:ABC transporter permease [Geminicoccaceae bacterium]